MVVALMTDRVSPTTRSFIMASVNSKNTGAELTVRKMLHRSGYRYTLHRRNLPGSPDIVFSRKRKVIFVHGCFWHGHDCRWGQLPKSRLDYWAPKIDANKHRDERNFADLRGIGWDALVVWQCELREPEAVLAKIIAFLEKDSSGEKQSNSGQQARNEDE